MKNLYSVVATAIFITVASTAVKAGVYIPVTPYTAPGTTTALQTDINGINNAGWTTGDIVTPDTTLGYVRDPSGNYTTISIPGATYVQAREINNNNQVVGFYESAGLNPSGRGEFTYNVADGSITLLNDSNGVPLDGIAGGINDQGTIVGDYRVPPIRRAQGYTLSGSTFTTLSVAGYRTTKARGINNSNTVTGWVQGFDGTIAGFIYKDGVYTVNQNPNAVPPNNFPFAQTFDEAINSFGQVVGNYVDASSNSHAFIYDINTQNYTYLDVAGSQNSSASGINDLGQVTIYSDIGSFIYDPNGAAVPEPASLALLGAGMGLIMSLKRRRNR